MRLARIVRGQWAGFLALFVAVTGVAGAATGQFARLGANNVADRTTSFTNQQPGPVLRLRGAGGPPFTVNSTNQVPNLNASLVGGHPATDFLAADGRQILAVDYPGSFADPRKVYDRSFIAPAAGYLQVVLIGTCRVNDENRGRFTIFADTTNYPGSEIGAGLALSDPVEIGCTYSTGKLVTDGQKVKFRVLWDQVEGDLAEITALTVLVSFDTRTPPK